VKTSGRAPPAPRFVVSVCTRTARPAASTLVVTVRVAARDVSWVVVAGSQML
jgi:hypothetical protein